MYKVPQEVIEAFVSENFKDIKWFTGSNEAKVISPFQYDSDGSSYMSINLGSGLWRVFGSENKKGNIFSLYAKMFSKTYAEAIRYFALRSFDTLNLDTLTRKKVVPTLTKTNIPDHWVPIDPFSKDKYHEKAFAYLYGRKAVNFREDAIHQQKFYLSNKKENEGRVYVPIIYQDKLVFYLSRDLTGKGFRYENCSSDKFTRADWILYPFDKNQEYVYVCEGIFDAISLQCLGVNATCIFGDSVSDVQLDLLRSSGCKIVAAFDNDKAGKLAVKRLDKKLKSLYIDNLYVCTPPDPYKDWNDFIIKEQDKVTSYIEDNISLYDFYYISLSSLGE